VTIAVALLFDGDRLYPALLVLSVCPLLLVASDRKRLPRRLRLPILLGSLLLVGALFVVRYSFMSPGSVAALAQVVFLASVFGGRRVVVLVWLVTTSVFVLGAIAWQHGVGASSLSNVAADEAGNWVRIGVVLPLVLLINGRMVLHMFSVAGDRVRILDRARRELERRQIQRQSETEALLRAETMRGRAERTATAGRVTGVVAHDLNNSLMALSGWAELLEDSDDPEEALQNLNQAVEHAEALLQTLRGTAELGHRGPGLDVGLALGRARAMLQAIWRTDAAQSCTLAVDSESGCFVAIQEASLRRLLVNLVTNARQALGDQAGSCTVRVRGGPHGVDLSVVDTGPGMDEATRARIFEPFFTTKPNLGTGLGLLSVSEIVRATDGELQVQSQPQQGSSFTIRWELAAPAAVLAATGAPQVEHGSSARVLLVEDESLVRGLLARGLRSAGYAVVEAEDGDRAVRQLHERGPFDALCTDAVMPGRSVFELISEYQAAHRNGVVLVLSGYLPENLAPLLTLAGVRLLRKPFSHSELVLELENLLRSRTLDDRHEARSTARRSPS
jgi:signal transduction histidine kinase